MTDDLPLPPAYHDAWVGAVLPALCGDGDARLLPEPARAAGQTVLLVCDGLGWDLATRPGLPTLGTLEGRAIDTTAPATTSTALTSITTGLPPAAHGVIGYRMRVAGQVMTTLAWNPDKGPEPTEVQPYPPFGGRELPVVTCAEFRGSGLTRAHLRGGTLLGWKATSTLVEHVAQQVAAGAPVVYAYYDGVDKVGHEFGPDSSFMARELGVADALVGELLAALPTECALVVTADHGMVATPPSACQRLDAIARMVTAWSGEGRMRSLYAAPGQSGRLAAACREAYSDTAWVLTREEVIDHGWLGGRPTSAVAGRVGDVVLAARGDAAFIAPDLPREGDLRGAHGSLTDAERHVPLLAARGHGASRSRRQPPSGSRR